VCQAHLLKRWCRWVLSAWKGDFPLLIRPRYTRRESNTGS
jgi:hypothetical protein